MDINKVIYRGVKVAFFIMLTLLIVYGTMKVSFTAYDFGYRVFTERAIDEKPGRYVEITIEKSMGTSEIAALLEENGLIRDAALFTLQYELSAYAGEIVPGTYGLTTAMTPKDMIIIMAEKYDELASEETETSETEKK